jgi:hypothetical protein
MVRPTLFDNLSDDVLGNVLSFCDFPSASSLTSCTCTSLRTRFSEVMWNEVLWRPVFERHGFMSSEPMQGQNYWKLCRTHRRLLMNLVSPSSKKRSIRQSFSLPQHRFSFLPITPKSDEFIELGGGQDPPPVFYECDSFALTWGTSSEMLFLDPCDGSLSIL